MLRTNELIEKLQHKELKKLLINYCFYIDTFYILYEREDSPVSLDAYYYNEYLLRDEE